MIKHVFFDFDGVLTTESVGGQLITYFVAKKLKLPKKKLLRLRKGYTGEKGKEFRTENYAHMENEGKLSPEITWAHLLGATGRDVADFPADFQVVKQGWRETKIDDVMLEFAKKLKRRRGMGIGMITDNPIERIREISMQNNLWQTFDPIIISAEWQQTKQGTNIFYSAARKAGLQPNECIFIDNRMGNIKNAIAAGMHAIFFDDVKRDYDGLAKEVRRVISKERLNPIADMKTKSLT